ncbi:hypothetical protein LZY01_01070 [Levilactobacillus zymae]|uniref:Uncharacterized protein n=1 Tax=Levilactobacillus zymae TaxID=267363 RepID=A0ABQ0WT02_9LACO|nr:hypothetical protein LZY01_01070 [Levilactobacillus zymae]
MTSAPDLKYHVWDYSEKIREPVTRWINKCVGLSNPGISEVLVQPFEGVMRIANQGENENQHP